MAGSAAHSTVCRRYQPTRQRMGHDLYRHHSLLSEGTVIPSLAIIEEPPEPPNARDTEKIEVNMSNAPDAASTAERSIPQQDQPLGLKKLARRMAPSFMGQVFAFITISIAGIGRESLQSWFGTWFPTSLALTFLFSVREDGVLFQCHSNAITKQRKSARQHLRTQYGRWSLYHGFDAFLAHIVLSALLVLITIPVICWRNVPFPAYVLARLFLGLPLTGLQMASLHASISKPNGKSIWNRIPGWNSWVKISPAASLDIILPTSGYYLTLHLRELLRQRFPEAIGLRDCPANSSPAESSIHLALFTAPFFASFLLSVVTRAIYARVAAALLPEDDECVVPFDPAFRKRDSYSHNGLSITLNACRTITFEGLFRYLRAVAEVVFVEVFCFGAFMTALFIQVGFSRPCLVQDYTILFATDVLKCSPD
ncbi:hypothetical protein PHISCL_08678 [Aspergillus sclerotialis]|uniref:Uncharacterized protein n=1 Tax=Aspergillus sclerotialis TaxID=2070753 RepID=A0A3A2ZI19_9EURO|nr:hypothetical protein PHISCL_08678 [Aspergillus sclerotialis]